MIELLDVVELLVDLPHNLIDKGYHGTIVECYPDNLYEVEFSDSDGETLDLLTLSANQFMVVWRVATHQWVSAEEQAIVQQTYQERNKLVQKTSAPARSKARVRSRHNLARK